MEVLIAGAGENTANLNQTKVLDYIWGEDVILAYVNPVPGRKKISLGYTFVWGERESSKWYEQAIKATNIEVSEYCDENICAAAGKRYN